MKYFGADLGEQHKIFSHLLRKPGHLEEAKQAFLDLHAQLNMSIVSGTQSNEVDHLIQGLKREQYAIMPTKQDETIAWVIWHLARIEDLTVGILVGEQEQLLTNYRKNKIGSPIWDTGNALNDDEIMELSKKVDIDQLLQYRNDVAKRTRSIVAGLTEEQIKQPVAQKGIDKIRKIHGVTAQEESIWLLDYWGTKDIGGILLMAPTRHAMLHLNDCCKWKESFITRKKFFRT